MERSEFERLISESGLQLVHTMNEPRFIVCLQLPAEFGTRYAGSYIAFFPDKFEKLAAEEARSHIEKCKADIIKEASKLGGLIQEDGTVKRVKKRKIA